jgi:lysophospholipase L1-like esterase
MTLLLTACATAQQPLPAALKTDPARAQVTLPEPANPKLPSLILIGDSTVRNGRDDGQNKGAAGQWGWGNPIAAWFDTSRVNVVNRAVGGLSSRTYVSSGHWERTAAFIKPGDVVIMQFGHNDAGPLNDSSRARGTIKGVGNEAEEIDNQLTGKRETVHSYGWYLRQYVAQIRAKGATPVICSQIPHKAWDEATGKARRDKASYAGWAEQVAREEQVAFIDLNEMTARRYDEMGRDAVMQMFPQTQPEERVHTNWAGAALNAEHVVAGLRAHPELRLGGQPLAGYLKTGAVTPAVPAVAAAAASAPAKEDDRPVVDARTVRDEAPANAALPTLFLVGDSTVKSGGVNGAIGWGERIAALFDTRRINVVNAAIGGRSSRTYFTEGRWDKVLSQMKRGDFVIIQFGHNDGGRIGDPAMKNRASAPGIGPETVEDTRPDGSREQVHSFGWYMARYTDDAKAKGVTVILAAPIPHKDKWQDGRDFATFAEWDQQVAAGHGALFMDLTLLVADGYKRIGKDKADTFFSDARTHTYAAGADFNAARVVAGLKALPGNPLGAYFAADAAVAGQP